MLKLESRGLKVVNLQAQLRNLGKYKGLITGVFDLETQKAVKSFQIITTLVPDGIVGPQTNFMLNKHTKGALLYLFLHCSATQEGLNVTAESVMSFHTRPVAQGGRGWSRPGYSDYCELSGKLVNLRDWNNDDEVNEWEYTFGVMDAILNRHTRHFCYAGGTDSRGVPKDTRTTEQLKTQEIYIKFHLLRYPDLIILGHNQVQLNRRGGCPSYNVPNWLKSIGVSDFNIGDWEYFT